MSLLPRAEPAGFPASLPSYLKGLLAGFFLFSSVMVCNVLQMASFIFLPVSRQWVRKINREIANAWWTVCDIWGDRGCGIEIEITGDALPDDENALLIANHRSVADIPALFRLARQKHRLGDLKWYVKNIIKYVPGIGWGMVFLDCIFLTRDWSLDQASLNRTFGKFKRENISMWVVSFVEGSRLNAKKLAESQAFATSRGRKPLEHLMIPRTKGFVATVIGLRDHLDAIYDTTLMYEDGVPSLWQWARGEVGKVHIHVRRYPVGELPASDTDLEEWVLARYQEKDLRLEAFFSDHPPHSSGGQVN